MQRTCFCCAKHWPSFSKFRKKVSKTKIFPLIIHQTLLHHLSWAHHLLCIYWNFRSKGHPINTSVSLTAASSSLDEMVMSSIIIVICTAYYAATTLWWILFLACGHSRCDSHERYCPSQWSLVMCQAQLGLGFSRLRLSKTQAQPWAEGQAWLGLGWAQARAYVPKGELAEILY